MFRAFCVVRFLLAIVETTWSRAAASQSLLGHLRIGGSSTVLPVSEAWAAGIGANYSDITVDSGGSSSGASRVCLPDGHPEKVDIGAMSREWRPSEALRLDDEYTLECSASGVRVTQIVIGIDGLAVVVGRGSAGHDCLTHPSVGGVTLAMLRWMFSSWTDDQLRDDGVNITSAVRNNDGDGVKEWSDLHEVCAQVPINPYGAGNKSGTHDFFAEKIFCKDCFTGKRTPYEGFTPCPTDQFAYDDDGHWVHEMSLMNQTDLGEYLHEGGGRTANCYVESESDRHILDWVRNDPGGIGYFGYAYFSYSSALTVVRIAADKNKGIVDTSDAKIEPSAYSITDGSYEVFRRKLFMNVDNSKWDLANDFMHYGFGESGQRKVTDAAGYIPINAALRAKMTQRISEMGNEKADYKSVPPDTCGEGAGLQAVVYANVHGVPKTNYTCQRCAPGSAKAGTAAEPCQACPAGMKANRSGLTQCTFCAVGKFSEGAATVCVDCPHNSVTSLPGMSSCVHCAAGTDAEQQGRSSCSRCAVGRYRPAGHPGFCKACPDGQTTNFQAAESLEDCKCEVESYLPASGGSSCVDCPHGMKCAFGSRAANIANLSSSGELPEGEEAPRVKPGYFSFSDEPLSIYQCLSTLACPGNGPESCGRNSGGVACGRCHDGYVRLEGQCSECGNIYKTRILFPMIPLIFGPPLIWLLYMFSQKDVEHWGSPLTGLAAMAYIILVSLQVIAVSGQIVVDIPAGVGMDGIQRIASTTMKFESFLRPECAIGNDAFATFLTRVLLPVFTAMLFVFTYLFMRFMPKLPVPNVWVLVNCFGTVFNTFYITIAAASMSLFQCYPHPNGKSSVRDASDVLCFEGEWNSLIGLAVTGLFLFCFLPIVIILYLVHIMPRYFDKSVNFRLSIKFIARKFCPEQSWWTVILLLKGVWINLATVFFTQGAGQILWLNSGLLMYAVGAVLVMPWRHDVVNLTDIASHCMLTYIFTVQAFFTTTTEKLKKDIAQAAVIIMLVDLLALLLGTAYLGYRLCIPVPELNIRKNALTMGNSFGAFSQQSERAASLLGLLSEKEVKALVAAAEIIRRESDESGIIMGRFSAQTDRFDAHHDSFSQRESGQGSVRTEHTGDSSCSLYGARSSWFLAGTSLNMQVVNSVLRQKQTPPEAERPSDSDSEEPAADDKTPVVFESLAPSRRKCSV